MNKENLQELWWLIVNIKSTINYEIYKYNDKFWLKVLVYNGARKNLLDLIIDLENDLLIKDLKNNDNYLKIIKCNYITQETKDKFNLVIDFVINNF